LRLSKIADVGHVIAIVYLRYELINTEVVFANESVRVSVKNILPRENEFDRQTSDKVKKANSKTERRLIRKSTEAA
jgi:hypothetical protein